jgi:predicted ATPase
VNGAGRVALVSGEAGIGKTQLVERLAADWRDRVRVLSGACDAHWSFS